MKEVIPGVFQVGTKDVNAFLVQHEGQVAIIDTGIPRMSQMMLDAALRLGNVTDILVSHYHNDHIGSLAEVADTTGAKVWAPAGDVHIIKGGGRPPDMEAHGLLGFVLSRLIHMKEQEAKPVHEVFNAGDTIPTVGGVEVIATPGHTSGHVCFLWPRSGGVLFCGDAAHNLTRLGPFPLNEDTGQARDSFRALAQRDFEGAVFGHGRPITKRASTRFRSRA